MGEPEESPESCGHYPFQDTDGHDPLEAKWPEVVFVL